MEDENFEEDSEILDEDDEDFLDELGDLDSDE